MRRRARVGVGVGAGVGSLAQLQAASEARERAQATHRRRSLTPRSLLSLPSRTLAPSPPQPPCLRTPTMRIASKRLAKELSDLRSGALPTGCTILQADDLQTWIFQIETLGETVFKGERFALRFRFDDQYPIESPEVVFVVSDGWKAPEASHVYSNGHLCECRGRGAE